MAVTPGESGEAFFLPYVPVGTDGLKHGFGGAMQPLPFLRVDVAEDQFASRGSTEMNVGGFPSHGLEQVKFGTRGGQGSEFDARAVGGDAADDPASAQLDKMVGTADGAVDDGLVKDFGGTRGIVSPGGGGREKSLGFAGDASAVPVGDGDVAGMAETAESGDPTGETVGYARLGHEMFEGIDGADRSLGFEGRECVDFLPEADGIAELALRDESEPGVIFAEDERPSFLTQAVAIAVKDCIADVAAFDGEASDFGGEVGADGEANQIDGIGHGPGFIEIVDTPDEAAFDVAPGAEVLDMKVADGEHARGLGEIGTYLWP